ncbi:hypothetical protein EDB81DRAFT_645679, partial [Dactylonectria macrodidyma]
LWGPFHPRQRLLNGESSGELHHSAYHEYYERQWSLTAANCDGKFVALKNPEDLNELIKKLQRDEAYEDLILEIQGACGGGDTDELCRTSLDLAARLLLMMRIGKPQNHFSHRPCQIWSHEPLRNFASRCFAETPKMSFEDVKLPKSFNGWSLETTGGIEIIFTNDLMDHLLLTEDDSKVCVFHYASFLECHRLQGYKSLLPTGLAEETLRTLALLFPQSITQGARGSKTTKLSWFRRPRDRAACTVDERLGRCGNLHAEARELKNFKFWRDRIVILKQVYDEASPRTLSQFWYDRRNGVQWYTFWAALLVLFFTVVFGVLQCVEGGYEAWH